MPRRGRQVTLDSSYLSDGRLDHGYALTAHKAQGATVDRTFVLGSQDLYRELGYTALSRHRDEARFYVARGDLEPKVQRDLPDYDPVVHGLEQLLERSGAKELALDSVKDYETTQLENGRDELCKLFEAHDLPSVMQLTQLGWERDRAHQALEDTDRRITRLQDIRDQTKVLQLRERGRLDQKIADAKDLREQQLERCNRTTAAHDLAAGTFHDWLGKYGDQAAQLVATDRELAGRQRLGRLAIARQDASERTPNWPERELPAPDLGHDLGIDLGW